MPDKEQKYFSDKWRLTGYAATLVIVLSMPLYLIIHKPYQQTAINNEPQFVGRETCVECHQQEHQDWLGSHHDLAMDSATEKSVLGNFNNYTFNHKGKKHRMFKKDGRFFINTEGENGKFNDFEISYTFGYTPLQQYLVAFPGGRYQCLPIAWDTDKGKWFHLGDTTYSDEDLQPESWLYWTNQAQNWNGMCADCHSTKLEKNYNYNKNTYNTTWFEIDVSCEACHGPSSEHLKWAQLPEGSRPMNENTWLPVKTSNISNEEYVNICARCHSRRGVMGNFSHQNSDILDHIIPQKAVQPFYFADGQILDEDYVYTSFTQSKMYTKDVQCNDCHNVHSTRLKTRGNDLCMQCHQPDIYDTPKHHFHKMPGENLDTLINNTSQPTMQDGEGALCVNCHMTGRFYMGNDYRRDHSFRVPRPDLTLSIGTPNACNDCHTDKSTQWSQNYILQWYGEKEKHHYGSTFAQAAEGKTEALPQLIKYTQNDVYPLMVRATAVVLLQNFTDSTSFEAIKLALTHPESLIRHSALMSFRSTNAQDYINYLGPLLTDQVKAVRTDAAFRLSELPSEMIPEKLKENLKNALVEYKEVQEYMGDFPGANYNLGNLYFNRGMLKEAASAYKKSIAIDKLFYQSKTNLAIIYNRLGKNKEAEKMFKELLREFPELQELNYSLALLLAEMGKTDESRKYLKKSTELFPENPRIWYNLALLESQNGNIAVAEKYFKKAMRLAPDNFDYEWALTHFYYQHQLKARALAQLEKLKAKYPNVEQIKQLEEAINALE